MIETECQRRIVGPTTFYVYRNQRHRRGHLLLVKQIYSELAVVFLMSVCRYNIS